MQYRKIKADAIFDGYQMLAAQKVLITKPNGTIEAIVNENEAGTEIEIYNGILCPGFINAHCHIELSHLKNAIPKHTGLVNFILDILKLRAADTQVIEQAMLRAADELYNSGTVAVGDICNTADSILLKKHSKLYWHNFIEVSGFVPNAAQQKFEIAQQVQQLFDNAALNNTMVAHAPYSVSANLFELINNASANKTLSIHNQETPTENEFIQHKNGDFLRLYQTLQINIDTFQPAEKTSFQYWLPMLSNAQKIISVHNTFINQADLQYAQQLSNASNLFFCLCPNANLFIENTLPPVDILWANNANIVLGTDSYASNTQLNIYEEIKTLQHHFTDIPLATILQWATSNGAKALGINEQYGSFEKGKKCGGVIIDNGVAKRLF